MTKQAAARDSHYTVDLAYPSQFLVAQTPLRMQWAAVCAGAAPGPVAEPFDYCDLGCGDGRTLNLLAACYPAGRFVGIDINPGHVARGRDLAARAGIENVSLIEASFADLNSLDLPPFDYVTAFGCYSWVTASLQQAIQRFAAHQLKPGGLLLLHYSSLPGAAVRDPLSNYLKWLSEALPGDSADRYRAAMTEVQQLVPFARFFEQNQRAAEMLTSMQKSSIAAGTHDVLNRAPHSQYFAEVHATAVDAGLEYLCNANLVPDYPELVLSRDALATFRRLTEGRNIDFREATRDILFDTSQRFDLYRRPDPSAQSGGNRSINGLGGLYLQRAGTKSDLELRQQLAGTSAADPAAPVCSAVLDLVEIRPLTVAAVLASNELAAYSQPEVELAIEHLFALGFLNLLIQRPPSDDSRARRPYRLTSMLNVQLLQDTIASPQPEWLASPVLGSPFRLPAANRLKLLALTGGDLDHAWRSLRTAFPDLRDSRGVAMTDFGRFRSEIERGLPKFEKEIVPQLLRAGILGLAD